MPNEHESRITERLTPAGEPAATTLPAMPRAHPAAPVPMPEADTTKPVVASSTAAPADATSSGWEVDEERLTYFARAVEHARERLRQVQEQVERMRGASFTPRLGTSPAGQQLEQKFTDRLDSPLDDPANPTTGGLRPMLAEAMRRMEEFIAGAESAAKSYTELDHVAAARVNSSGQPATGR
jgi:hypothetical protein